MLYGWKNDLPVREKVRLGRRRGKGLGTDSEETGEIPQAKTMTTAKVTDSIFSELQKS